MLASPWLQQLFAVQGSVLSGPPKYSLWLDHFRSHAAGQCTHTCTHSHTRPSQKWLLVLFLCQQIEQTSHLSNRLLFFQLFRSMMISTFPPSVATGCGGPGPIKRQDTTRFLTKPDLSLNVQRDLCVEESVRENIRLSSTTLFYCELQVLT